MILFCFRKLFRPRNIAAANFHSSSWNSLIEVYTWLKLLMQQHKIQRPQFLYYRNFWEKLTPRTWWHSGNVYSTAPWFFISTSKMIEKASIFFSLFVYHLLFFWQTGTLSVSSSRGFSFIFNSLKLAIQVSCLWNYCKCASKVNN